MPPAYKIRSSQGCWTCRLRRKKCDERKPICSICDALEITCYYEDKKPEWMDGGGGEKKMADDLKAMVKAKASERRERKWASFIEAEERQANPAASPTDDEMVLSRSMADSMNLDSSTDGTPSHHTPATSVTEENSGRDHSPQHPAPSEPTAFPSVGESADLGRSPFTNVLMPLINSGDSSITELEHELNFAMIYLDYVFPFLSPFYRPGILEAGRGWLLVILQQNKSLFHTALSLASYFFAIILQNQEGGHEDCMQANWTGLQKQQELAIQQLQCDMQRLNDRGVAAAFGDSVQVLESIIQLLNFEVAVSKTENWQVHLDAANVLFEQILQAHAIDTTKPWYSILERMNRQSLAVQCSKKKRPWAPDQAAFRFFTAQLLWTDILAATALERPPTLRNVHNQLLEGDLPKLDMEDFTGCHNWVILLIGHIAALDAWKKEMKATSSLSMVELVNRATCIEGQLRAGIAQLDTIHMDVLHDPSARAPDLPYSGLGIEAFTGLDKLHTTPSLAFHSKIWACSALTYLAVVVNGFQPALPEIQSHVTATIALFRQMPSPLCLRTLVWPFAVTGCLSLPGHEQFFRDQVSNMGALQVFGTVKEALNVMSAVWEHRLCIQGDNWDIAACLGVLGHRSLLV